MKKSTDPERLQYEETGIPVRAQDEDGRWGSVDLVHLDLPSLFEWLHSRGSCNPWAETVVAVLLGHPDPRCPGAPRERVVEAATFAEASELVRRGAEFTSVKLCMTPGAAEKLIHSLPEGWAVESREDSVSLMLRVSRGE